MRLLWVLLGLSFSSATSAEEPPVKHIKDDDSRNQDKPGPYKVFKTEPTFVPSIIRVVRDIGNESLIAPGYTFIAPHIGSNGFGPQIIDQKGELVWYGNPHLAQVVGSHVYGMDVRVCDFQGSIGTHLCWSEGRPKDMEDQGVKAGGANRIFNNAYETVAEDFTNMNGLTTPNPHEYNMLPGGNSFIQTVFEPKEMDLRPYEGKENGWVLDGCFQEVDVRFRSVIFQWCYLDHHPVWETYLYLHISRNKVNSSSGTSGTGRKKNPWDFMHLNAVDKNEEGDYLVSARHFSQILKIAGPNSRSGQKPGSIIWRLNGRHSDFKVTGEAKFGRQHHCRYLSTGKDETVISLFNNAFDGVSNATRERSAGLILRLNNETMKAEVEQMFENPFDRLSYAQGSVHVQPNGNVHVGWGSFPSWSEFSPDGTLLYHAKVWTEELEHGRVTNYRSFKYDWVGRPKTKPKLVAYSQTCNSFASAPLTSKNQKLDISPLIAYVSWNGATEVSHWRFFVTAQDQNGPWTQAGTFARDGFETEARLSSNAFEALASFATWVTVEALDARGNVLGTNTVQTFVPNYKVKYKCGLTDCNSLFRFEYRSEYSRSRTCRSTVSYIPLIIGLVFLLLGLESWEKMYNTLMDSAVSSTPFWLSIPYHLAPQREIVAVIDEKPFSGGYIRRAEMLLMTGRHRPSSLLISSRSSVLFVLEFNLKVRKLRHIIGVEVVFSVNK